MKNIKILPLVCLAFTLSLASTVSNASDGKRMMKETGKAYEKAAEQVKDATTNTAKKVGSEVKGWFKK